MADEKDRHTDLVLKLGLSASHKQRANNEQSEIQIAALTCVGDS